MKLMKISLLFFVALSKADAATMKPSVSVYAITNTTVLTMEQDRIEKNQTIIITDQKITAIGPAKSTPIPPAAKIISGLGKFVMPGLVDMHNHLTSQDELILNLANGVTSLRVMWGNPDILKWKNDIRAGQLLGPTIYTAGPILDGDPPVHEGSVILNDPAHAEIEVRKEAQQGYDFVKIYNNLNEDVYQSILKTAKVVGLPVVGHVPTRVGIEQAWVSQQHSIEHWQGLLDFLRKAPGSSDFDISRIPLFVQKTVRSGVWNCPTMVVIQRGFVASVSEMDKWLREPETNYVLPDIKTMWTDYIESVRTQKDWPTKASQTLNDLGPRLTKELHSQGARLLIGTDTPNPFVVPGFAVHLELKNFQDAGLAPYEVLKIATRNGAEALGQIDKIGSVAVGKSANLLILDSDPTLDVKVVKDNLNGVMLAGSWLLSSELQGKLKNIADKYAQGKRAKKTVPRTVEAAYGKLHFH